MNTPRPAVAREFYENVIGLGKLARARYFSEVRKGLRDPDFNELRELEKNIEICQRELARFQ